MTEHGYWGLPQNVNSVREIWQQVPTGAIGAFQCMDFNEVGVGKAIHENKPVRKASPAPSRPVRASRFLAIISDVLGKHYVCSRGTEGDARLGSISISEQPYLAFVGGFYHLCKSM